MKLVKFNKHYRCYNAGEIAGFEEPFAEGLIGSGIATLVVDTPGVAKDVPVLETSGGGPALDDEIEGEGEEKGESRRGRRNKS